MALLDVRDLRVVFHRRGTEPFPAVDGVTFAVEPGQTIGLVGESLREALDPKNRR